MFVWLLLISAGCDFKTAFEKGARDAETHSYGANLDKFCFAEPDDLKDKFLDTYQLGRNDGPKLRQMGIEEIPSSKEELGQLYSRGVLRVQADTELAKKSESARSANKAATEKMENE